MVPRPTTSSTVAKEVASGVFAGHATALTSSPVSIVPAGTSRAAITTVVICTGAGRAARSSAR